MDQDRTVQVLLASYNGEKYIAEQIDSILNQDYQHFTLTVRDDGSTDRTLSIVTEFASRYPQKIRVLANNGEKGLGASLNFGRLLDAVDGSYFMFCDQDDVWFRDKISRSVEAITGLETQGGKDVPLLVFSDLEVTDNKLNVLHPSFWELRKLDPAMAFSYEELIANNVIAGCTILFNRAARQLALPIPANRFLHDQWIGFHVAYYGKLSFLKEPTLFYRQHEKNEMGARNLTSDYFFKKISFFPRLWSDWRWLKSKNTIPVNLGRIFWLKLRFNIGRLFTALKKK